MKTKQYHTEITIHPEILGGIPVFKNTRVPVQTLFDYLEGNYTLEQFLEDFPTVKKRQALTLLKNAEKLLLAA